jgi:hypothetical protein
MDPSKMITSFQQTGNQVAIYDPQYMMNNFLPGMPTNNQNSSQKFEMKPFEDQMTFMIRKGVFEDDTQDFIQR